MDLVQSIRKEGSRGGRANFSWEDVKGDEHRENYLGHSLMARKLANDGRSCSSHTTNTEQLLAAGRRIEI